MSNNLKNKIMDLFFKKNKSKAITHSVSDGLITNISNFAIEEAYKTARTNIIFALSGKKGCKTVVITGANQSEGKTTTSVNVAITFAELGERVLIIDADLRRSNIHHFFDLSRKDGLSDILCDLVDCKKAIRKNVINGLDFIPAGQLPPNPAELLASERMKRLLSDLSSDYDYIFIDTPPINVVTDASIVSKICDGLVIVTRQNYTTYDDVSDAVKSLNFADCHILGIIVNDVNLNIKSGYRYAKSYKKYGYNYQYSHNNKESKKIDGKLKEKQK